MFDKRDLVDLKKLQKFTAILNAYIKDKDMPGKGVTMGIITFVDNYLWYVLEILDYVLDEMPR